MDDKNRSSGLLTREQEVSLAHTIEVGVLADEALTRGACAADRSDLVCLASEGRRAWHELIQANLRLVWLEVHALKSHGGVSSEELFQEGCLGLMRAALRFDHRRGCRFATMALPWIRSAITDAVVTRGGEEQVPVWLAREARRVHAIRARLEIERGQAPDMRTLAEACGRSQAWIRTTLERRTPLLVGESTVLGEWVDAAHDEKMGAQSVHGVLQHLLAGLPALECQIIVQRFGLGGDEPTSVESLAVQLRLSPSTVRRLEKRGLQALREQRGDLVAA